MRQSVVRQFLLFALCSPDDMSRKHRKFCLATTKFRPVASLNSSELCRRLAKNATLNKSALRRHGYSLIGECGRVVRVKRLRIDCSGTNFKGCRGIVVKIFLVL